MEEYNFEKEMIDAKKQCARDKKQVQRRLKEGRGVRVGYPSMGDRITEIAARKMSEDAGYEGAVFIPLANQDAVIDSVRNGRIDAGVVATHSSGGGVLHCIFDTIMQQYLSQKAVCVLSSADNKDKKTEYKLLALPEFSYENDDESSCWRLFIHHLYKGRGASPFSKLLFTECVAGAIMGGVCAKVPAAQTAFGTGITLLMTFGILGSRTIAETVRCLPIVGYWKYCDSQNGGAPRVAKISKNDGKLSVEVFVCGGDADNVLLKSTSCILEAGSQEGKLVYEYGEESSCTNELGTDGTAVLNWSTDWEGADVHKMSGYCFDKSLEEIESITYLRISKEEFMAMKHGKYLSR